MYPAKYVNHDDEKRYFSSNTVEYMTYHVDIDSVPFISIVKLISDPRDLSKKIPRKNLCIPVETFRQICAEFNKEKDTNTNKDK